MKITASFLYVFSIHIKYAPFLVLLVLVACSPATTILPQATATLPQATATMSQAAVPPATATATVVSQEPIPFLLSERGPYYVGTRKYDFNDANREDRFVGITVWYPAVQPADATGSKPSFEAGPDVSGAPYPLILSSAKVGNIFAPHLASHGFVVAGVDRMDSYGQWGVKLIDYPLDILFALDQIASTSLNGLEGMIDANRAGAMGYSFDGYNALALSGARVDPAFYSAQCAEAPTMDPAPPEWWIYYICTMANTWDEFAAHAGDAITASDDGLWQPMTDERIRAVIPMGPEGAWLFGERGLAAVDRPTLIIAGTADDINIYDLEAVYIFEHLGTADRSMISFVGDGHMVMVSDHDHIDRLRHFTTAYFGYHLQGREDYAEYFLEDFVGGHDDLAWGVYEDE